MIIVPVTIMAGGLEKRDIGMNSLHPPTAMLSGATP